MLCSLTLSERQVLFVEWGRSHRLGFRPAEVGGFHLGAGSDVTLLLCDVKSFDLGFDSFAQVVFFEVG